MAVNSDGISFYFFDFDDNIMYLDTPIFLRNKKTEEEKPVTTGQFAAIQPLLGKAEEWKDYDEPDDQGLRCFRDMLPNKLKPGQKQYFVEDVEKAVTSGSDKWKAPSWDLFVHACTQQRPVSIVTARGHSPETLKAGAQVLVDHGLIPKAPNYHTVFPVGNDEVRRTKLEDPSLQKTTAELKRIAIEKSVDEAMDRYGAAPTHRFGMSDDDPVNVDLIIRAMCACKKKYLDKRFFVINTHEGEHVKLEVFPVDYPVIGPADSTTTEPLE